MLLKNYTKINDNKQTGGWIADQFEILCRYILERIQNKEEFWESIIWKLFKKCFAAGFFPNAI